MREGIDKEDGIMMKKSYVLAALFIFAICLSVESMFEEEISRWFVDAQETIDEEPLIEVATEIETKQEEPEYIGLSEEEVTERFGEPIRKDASAYGYVWWIYPEAEEGYMQVGFLEGKVVTVFMAYRHQQETYEQLREKYDFQKRVEIKNDDGIFEFELTDEDIKSRPLIYDDGVWQQIYFDSFTGYASSVRMMNDDILLKLRPYSISYRGQLPNAPILTEEEWEKVEKGEAKQIFQVTNVIRQRHGLKPLQWEEEVAQVAYLHSREMSEYHYFSHTSPISGELQDRFKEGKISFRLAGENIAAQYVDGIAAVEGWLNSEGHRVNVLHEEFSHLGVGVYQHYYTQNFLVPFLHSS